MPQAQQATRPDPWIGNYAWLDAHAFAFAKEFRQYVIEQEALGGDITDGVLAKGDAAFWLAYGYVSGHRVPGTGGGSKQERTDWARACEQMLGIV